MSSSQPSSAVTVASVLVATMIVSGYRVGRTHADIKGTRPAKRAAAVNPLSAWAHTRSLGLSSMVTFAVLFILLFVVAFGAGNQ